MPMKVRCSKCKKVIYESKDLLTPDEIISRFDGRCPHCGHKLEHFPSEVKISSVEKRASAFEASGKNTGRRDREI